MESSGIEHLESFRQFLIAQFMVTFGIRGMMSHSAAADLSTRICNRAIQSIQQDENGASHDSA